MSTTAAAYAPARIVLCGGDALQYPADLAIIGSGPALLQRIERDSGRPFLAPITPEFGSNRGNRVLHSNLSWGTRVHSSADSDDFPWRHCVAVSAPPSRRRQGGLHLAFDALLGVVIPHRLQPQRVLLLPYQTRPAVQVAMNLLCLAWCMQRLRPLRKQQFRPAEVRIVDREGNGALFRELLHTADSPWPAFLRHLPHCYRLLAEALALGVQPTFELVEAGPSH